MSVMTNRLTLHYIKRITYITVTPSQFIFSKYLRSVYLYHTPYIFNPKLKFDYYINNIVKKSNKILGFIYQNFVDFTNKHASQSI